MDSFSNMARTVIVRRTKNILIDGFYSNSTIEEFSIAAVVQNIAKSYLQNNPDGRRTDKELFILTNADLFDVRTGENNPDEIIVDNEIFEIKNKLNFNQGILDHFEYEVTRKAKAQQ